MMRISDIRDWDVLVQDWYPMRTILVLRIEKNPGSYHNYAMWWMELTNARGEQGALRITGPWYCHGPFDWTRKEGSP
jgi:hypothetical protein